MYIKWTVELTHSLKKKLNVNRPTGTTSFAHTHTKSTGNVVSRWERERVSTVRITSRPTKKTRRKRGAYEFSFFPKSRQIALGLPTFSLFSHSTFFLLLLSLLFWQCFPFFHFLRFLVGALLRPTILMRETRLFSLLLNYLRVSRSHNTAARKKN